jgi:PAS domain S-box-containing protein
MVLTANISDQSVEDLLVLLDSANDLALIFTDAEHNITRWSVGAELILGWSEHEIVGSRQIDLIYTPEDRAAGIPQQDQDIALQNGRVEDNRWYLKKDGTRFFAAGVLVALYNHDGTLRGFGKLLRDQTKQRQMEEHLRASESHLFALFARAPVGLSEISLDGRFLQVNDELCRILGRTRQEMLSANILEVTHSEYLQASLDAVAEVIETGGMISLDKRYLRPDGSAVWANSSLSLLLRCKEDKAGKDGMSGKRDLRTLLAVTVDITLRKHAEEELRRSEQEQRTLAQLLEKKSASLAEAQALAKMGNWELDFATNTLTWSDEIYRIFGVAPETFGGTYEDFLQCLPPEDRAVVDKTFTESLTSQTPYSMEHRIRREDGSYRVVQEYGQMFYDAQGLPLRSVGTCQDITERKRLEQQMIHTKKMAALGELTAGIAHEINNPLTAISGYAQFLQKHADSGVRADATIIDDMVTRAVRIVRALRSYARTNDNKKVAINLNEVVTSALDIISVKLRHSNVALEMNLGTNLPLIPMNRGEMEQVVVNLLSNAEHALRTKPVDERLLHITTHITTDRRKEQVSSGQIRDVFLRDVRDVCVLTIQDSGSGIPKEIQDRIFDPFFTTKEVNEGTGLGLYISHEIITAHGFAIEVESHTEEDDAPRHRTEGGSTLRESAVGSSTTGTTFTITLPVEAEKHG